MRPLADPGKIGLSGLSILKTFFGIFPPFSIPPRRQYGKIP
jgi:hypothetical protein